MQAGGRRASVPCGRWRPYATAAPPSQRVRHQCAVTASVTRCASDGSHPAPVERLARARESNAGPSHNSLRRNSGSFTSSHSQSARPPRSQSATGAVNPSLSRRNRRGARNHTTHRLAQQALRKAVAHLALIRNGEPVADHVPVQERHTDLDAMPHRVRIEVAKDSRQRFTMEAVIKDARQGAEPLDRLAVSGRRLLRMRRRPSARERWLASTRRPAALTNGKVSAARAALLRGRSG